MKPNKMHVIDISIITRLKVIYILNKFHVHCCLMPSEQFFSSIMARTGLMSMEVDFAFWMVKKKVQVAL
jgi:hypothetical protein